MLNDKFINRKLVEMNPSRQKKVVRALNRMAKKFKGLIPKRDPPKIATLTHRPRTFVSLRDVMGVLHDLLATCKKRMVHFALDLYVILLGGQRFLADFREIERGLKQLVESNRSRQPDNLALSFEMRVGKTCELV